LSEKSHWTAAFRWSNETRVHLIELVSAGLGFAIPVLVGAQLGEPQVGLVVAALGAIAMGGVAPQTSSTAQLRALAQAFLPAVLAAAIADVAPGLGVGTAVASTLIASIAAALGGFSRATAVVSARFIVFLLIVAGVTERTPDPVILLSLTIVGALFVGTLNFAASILIRALAANRAPPPDDGVKTASAAQSFARWKQSLARFSGWQFPLRLALCLAIADFLQWKWPDHHLNWVAVTIALLSQRQLEIFPIKITQRALGTALGVLCATAIVIEKPPNSALIIAVGLLAAARPLLRVRNYLLYSAVMAPLTIIVMDAGEPLGMNALLDRLIATVIGAALVVATNFLFARLLKTFE
jgi:hypothetical protein